MSSPAAFHLQSSFTALSHDSILTCPIAFEVNPFACFCGSQVLRPRPLGTRRIRSKPPSQLNWAMVFQTPTPKKPPLCPISHKPPEWNLCRRQHSDAEQNQQKGLSRQSNLGSSAKKLVWRVNWWQSQGGKAAVRTSDQIAGAQCNVPRTSLADLLPRSWASNSGLMRL